MTDKRFLFIAGIARSGTTALAELVGAHPNIIMGVERYFNLVKNERFRELKPELFLSQRLFQPVPDETHNYRWREDERYVRYLRAKYETAKVIGDKVPNYFVYANHLFATMQEARMLLITRDPLNVADSWKRRKMDSSDTVWDSGPEIASRQWSEGHKRMIEVAETYAERIGVVVYEDLFSGDRKTFERLLAWLDAGPLNPWAMDYYQRAVKDWQQRAERELTLTAAEREIVDRQADRDLQRSLIALAGI